MGIVENLLRDVALPRMVRVHQNFPATALADVAAAVRAECRKPEIAAKVKPGARIAVTAGSRGLADLPVLVSTVVAELKRLGAEPFIVPAMGSHGGATDEGQKDLLGRLGVTEESAGCPIRSSMKTVQLGVMAGNNLPVLMDANAMGADGIVLINRVKPHTSFSGPYESGLVKMISIGLGKQQGAESCHALGFGAMAKNIVAMAEIKLAKAPFLFGLASLENACEKVAKVVAVPAERIMAEEPALLLEAKAAMPSIPFTPIDVLVVDRTGKEFSGSGADPNITGRADTPHIAMTQHSERMVFLDLSDTSHGNATGLGLADVITKRFRDKIDYEATYANHITATVIGAAAVPMTMPNDRLALQAAVKTCCRLDIEGLRMVRVKNSLHLDTMQISEGLLAEARNNPRLTIESEPEAWPFDAQGNLPNVGAW